MGSTIEIDISPLPSLALPIPSEDGVNIHLKYFVGNIEECGW